MNVRKIFGDARRAKKATKKLVFCRYNSFGYMTDRIEYKTDKLWTADELFRMESMGFKIDWKQVEECEYDCHYNGKYGFVPEAGCPVHD